MLKTTLVLGLGAVVARLPEHFTATLVGHKSARSENKLTYSIYSAGISDEQKRSIIDSIRLPEWAA